MTDFTPGPWVVVEDQDGKPPHVTRYFWINADGNERPVDYEWAILSEANAHLIAAAPCLYEALSEFREAHFHYLERRVIDGEGSEAFDNACHRVVEANQKAEAALAKARGEKQ